MADKKPYRLITPTTFHWDGDVVWLEDHEVRDHHEPVKMASLSEPSSVPPEHDEPLQIPFGLESKREPVLIESGASEDGDHHEA